jgi:hypothetical protein
LPVTNTLAYFALSPVTKKRSFITLTPAVKGPGEVIAVARAGSGAELPPVRLPRDCPDWRFKEGKFRLAY